MASALPPFARSGSVRALSALRKSAYLDQPTICSQNMLKDFLLFCVLFCEFLVGFVGLVVFLAAAGVAIGSFLGALAGSAVYIYDVILGAA